MSQAKIADVWMTDYDPSVGGLDPGGYPNQLAFNVTTSTFYKWNGPGQFDWVPLRFTDLAYPLFLSGI